MDMILFKIIQKCLIQQYLIIIYNLYNKEITDVWRIPTKGGAGYFEKYIFTFSEDFST